MALTRVRSFTAGTLDFNDLEAELNNIRDYINTRTLSNPLTQDLDFGNQFTVDNLRTLWAIRNGSEFGGFTGSSIQAAINDLPSTGGIVFLPEGTYTLSQTLELRNGVTLWGVGNATILQRNLTAASFTATASSMIRLNSVNDVLFKDLQIDGAAIDNTSQSGLTLVNVAGTSARFKAVNCYVRRSGTTAQSNSAPNDGIRLDSSGRGFWISDCLFENFRRNALSVVNADRFFIIGNEITNTGGSGTDDSNTAVDIEPTSGNAQRGVVSGNVIRGWRTSGIVALASGITTVDETHGKLILANNEISDIGIRGILVQTLRNVEVVGNTLDQTLQQAANATGSLHILNCEEVLVQGNQVYRTGTGQQNDDGIMVQCTSATQGCSGIVVEGNQVHTSSRHGIIVNSNNASAVVENVKILGNIVAASGQTDTDLSHGISVQNTSGTLRDLDIIGNTVTLDGTTPANASHHAVSFSGTIRSVVLTGNNLRNGFTGGSGLAVNGRSNVTQLEEGHNILET